MTLSLWLKALLRREGRGLILAIVLQSATSVFGVLLIATSAWLIAAAALRPPIAALGVAIVGVRFFGLGRAVSRYGERLVTHHVTLGLLGRLRRRVFEHLVPLGPAWLFGRDRGDVLATVVSDVDALDGLIVRALVPSVSALCAGLVAVLLLGWLNVAFGVVLAVGLVVVGVLIPAVVERLGRQYAAGLARDRGQLSSRVVDTVSGLADLLVFNRGSSHFRLTGLVQRRVAAGHLRSALLAASGSAAGQWLTDLTAMGALVVGTALISQGTFARAHLAVVVLTTVAAFEIAGPLSSAFQGLNGALESARRVRAIECASAPVPVPDPPAPHPVGCAIEVRSLEFTYPGNNSPALDDVSLTLVPGRVVAVVGASGSGKSTLMMLLARHWDVPAGSVFLDDRDIRDFVPDQVRECLSVAEQPVSLLTGTLRENLAVATPTASDDELMAVLDRVGLAATVRRLPGRLDSQVGELGVALSGGERQRLALARALLRQAPFLLLDEPTAHIDVESEAALFEELARERATRGVLITTHRLGHLAVADEIMVLRHGRVVQRGSFLDLSISPGWFRDALRLERNIIPD